MLKGFDEWCEGRVCSECRYDHLGSMDSCRVAHEEDTRELGFSNLATIERKLDAIIKHLNVPVD